MPFPTDPDKQAEVRKKMSESAKRRAADPEYRKMLSERAKQQFSNPEARKAASERTKRQMADTEAKRLQDEKRRAALQKPETRAKMSKSAKRKLANPQEKQRLDALRAEGMRTPETRAKMAEKQKRVMADPARREHLRQKTLEQFSNPEARQRHRELTLQQFSNPEAGKAHSDWLKAFYSSPASEYSKQRARETLHLLKQQSAFTERRLEGLAQARKSHGTDIECIVETLLQTLDIEYEAQKRIGWWIVDFYVPGKNLIIECDGDYWHSLPVVAARDIRKNAYFTRKGYQVLRLPGSQILAGNLTSLESLFA